MTKEETIWQYSREQRDIGSSMDAQRVSISNFVITLTAGLIALMSLKDLLLDKRPLAACITILGLYGIATTRKLYERQMFHFARSRECLKILDLSLTHGQIEQINSAAKAAHCQSFRFMRTIRNHQVWMVLHIIIAMLGIVLLVLMSQKK